MNNSPNGVVMKRIISIFLLSIMALPLPALGQSKSVLTKSGSETSKKPPVAVQPTSFEIVESFSEGAGAWVRWRMKAETNNAGFFVYRVGKSTQPVSDLIAGASMRDGLPFATGNEYFYFDRQGGIGTSYYVVAMPSAADMVTSRTVASGFVASIDQVKGGEELRAESLRYASGRDLVEKELSLSTELNQEVQSSLITPDPVKHRQVISQPGVKISSKTNGLIRVTRAQLEAAGFNADSNSANWQLFMEGVELPIMIGPNADYIEFIGKPLDTIETDIRAYFLISGKTTGKRIIATVARRPQTSVVSEKYNQTFTFKPRTQYLNGILNGEAENYWGPAIFSTGVNINLLLTGIDRTPGTRSMRINLQGYSTTPHRVEVVLNGTALGAAYGNWHQPYSFDYDLPVDLLLEGNNVLNLKSSWDDPNTPGIDDTNVFDKIEIDFPRKHVAESNVLRFYTDNYRNSKVSGFTTPDIKVFDVTSETETKLITNLPIVETNGTWGPQMPASRGRVYYAVGSSNFAAPLSVVANDPGLIGTPENSGTFLVITHPSLMAQAQAWADYRSGQGIASKVVSIEDIYDEFNYGSLSSDSIKNFLAYAKTNWQVPPQYVLLVGDASYDSRNYVGNGYWNMVPTKLVDTIFTQTASDEALADFNNDGLAEIPIGRAASRTAVGVSTMLSKTIAWENSLTPTSTDRGFLFVYDVTDERTNPPLDFGAISQRVAATLPSTMPKQFIWKNDASSLQTILNAVNEVDPTTPANSGQYLVNWTGHGAAGLWSGSGWFGNSSVSNMTNGANPTIFTSLSCLNAYFVQSADSLAEVLTKAPNGGGVAVWASTGLTTSDVQEVMANRFFLKLGEGSIPRLGDLILDAKGQVVGGNDVRLSWALLGDPMLKVR